MYSIGKQVILCLITSVLWGISPIVTRLYTDIVGIRVYLIANTVMQGVATCLINSALHKGAWGETGQVMFIEGEWKRWLLLMGNSILCLSAPFVIYNTLLSNTESIAVIVTTTWYGAPILTSVLGIFVFGQRLSWLQIGGMCVCIGGVVMMNVEDMIKEHKASSENISLINGED